MSAFDEALAVVLEHEQGFVHNARDRGGPTNLGITSKSYRAYFGRLPSIADIRALTPEMVAPIYRKLYWDALGLDRLPARLAAVVFNQAVLRGTNAAAVTLQRALGVFADGVIGSETVAAAHAGNIDRVIFHFLRESELAFIRIVTASPDQLLFLKGWSSRVFSLLEKYLVQNDL